MTCALASFMALMISACKIAAKRQWLLADFEAAGRVGVRPRHAKQRPIHSESRDATWPAAVGNVLVHPYRLN